MRLRYAVTLGYEVERSADFIFNVQAAHTRHQHVVSERMDISQPVLPNTHTEPGTRNRYLRLQAGPGTLNLAYEATVDISHHAAVPESLEEVPIAALPGHVLPYLYPSRYCESDQLMGFSLQRFGPMPRGHARVQAIRDWVANRVEFRSNTSDGNTSASDTLKSREGVCRDFAHLMIALCRAVNIPARFATGFDYGADPILGPQDFHAYVEVYLSHRWYLFDPSGTSIPMGFVRIATGRDAADAAFATIFGRVHMQPPVVQIEPVPNHLGDTVTPVHRTEALSTDAGDL